MQDISPVAKAWDLSSQNPQLLGMGSAPRICITVAVQRDANITFIQSTLFQKIPDPCDIFK